MVQARANSGLDRLVLAEMENKGCIFWGIIEVFLCRTAGKSRLKCCGTGIYIICECCF